MGTIAYDIQLKEKYLCALRWKSTEWAGMSSGPRWDRRRRSISTPNLTEGRAHTCLPFVIVASWQIMCGISGFKAYFTPELVQVITQALSLTKDLSTSKIHTSIPSFEC